MHALQLSLGQKEMFWDVVRKHYLCAWVAKNSNMPIGYAIIPLPATWDQLYIWQREYFTAKMGQNPTGIKTHMNLGHIGYEPDVAHFVNPGIQLLRQVLCIFAWNCQEFCSVFVKAAGHYIMLLQVGKREIF